MISLTFLCLDDFGLVNNATANALDLQIIFTESHAMLLEIYYHIAYGLNGIVVLE